MTFIATGTGRCGTLSLARIVRSCENSFATHEGYPLTWKPSARNEEMLRQFIDRAKRAEEKGTVFGDSSLTWVNHLDEIVERVPGLKVITLSRDPEELVRSFLAHSNGYTRLRPQDKMHCYTNTKAGWSWFEAYPNVDPNLTPPEAWYEWWKTVSEKLSRFQESGKAPVLNLHMLDLNKQEKLKELFDFIEVPEANRVYPDKRRWRY